MISVKYFQQAGDMELNPQPQTVFKFLAQMFNREKRKSKYCNINCQSLVKKKNETLEDVLNLRENTIYGITETCLIEPKSYNQAMETQQEIWVFAYAIDKTRNDAAVV